MFSCQLGLLVECNIVCQCQCLPYHTLFCFPYETKTQCSDNMRHPMYTNIYSRWDKGQHLEDSRFHVNDGAKMQTRALSELTIQL